jgi:hypothetical protein
MAHFLRLRRKKPGYPLQFLSPRQVPAGGFRYFRSYPLRGRKTASMPFFAFRSLRKAQTPTLKTAGIPAGPLPFFASGVCAKRKLQH